MDETYEAPAPASIKGRNLMPWISITTKGYVTWLSFVVNRTFDVFSQIEVRCFSLQLAHALLMRQSEAGCLGTVQLKYNFFFQRLSLRSGVPLTNSYLLDLWPGFPQWTQTYAGFLSLSLICNKFSILKFFSEFPAVLGFLSTYLLKESTNWQKSHLSNLTRFARLPGSLSRVSLV